MSTIPFNGRVAAALPGNNQPILPQSVSPQSVRRSNSLNKIGLLLCLASLICSGSLVVAASAQSAARQDLALPDPPRPLTNIRQLSYNLDAVQSGATQQSHPGAAANDQKTGTLEKPISQNPVPSGEPPQTRRILGLIPNFRSVSTDVKLPPMTVKQKFLTAFDESFDYSSIFVPAAVAAFSMGEKATPEFGQGAIGYGRYFWHSALDHTTEDFMVDFVFPVIVKQDNRYYTLGHGGLFKRAGYAISRTVVTRSDSGHATFNISEVAGSGASSGISSFYYPSRERSFGNVAKEWGIDIGIDSASFVAREFWPDINRRLFRHHEITSESAH
jgi:hypothetical protein